MIHSGSHFVVVSIQHCWKDCDLLLRSGGSVDNRTMQLGCAMRLRAENLHDWLAQVTIDALLLGLPFDEHAMSKSRALEVRRNN
jgi:hypothetical protein